MSEDKPYRPDDKSYRPVGRCIYCGTTEGKLQNEHVIPYGLDSDMVLPKASCAQCAKVTSGFERKVLRDMLTPARMRLKMPTRRPAKRPKQLFHTVLKGNDIPPIFNANEATGKWDVLGKWVPPEEHPQALCAYDLPPAGILRGLPPSRFIEGKLWIQTPADMSRRMGPPGTSTILVVAQAGPLLRMVAKIAHSYAVAEEGLHSFKPMLMDLILGDSETGTYWIGGIDPPPTYPRIGQQHTLETLDRVVNGVKLKLARVCLFYGQEAPGYEVVVGECT